MAHPSEVEEIDLFIIEPHN